MERSFVAPIWMTFRQAKELGGHVRKGEKGAPVVYANTIVKTDVDEKTGDDVDVTIPFMKGYTVFNVEQIEDLPAHYYARAESSENPDFFAKVGASIQNGGNSAYYRMASDYIQMPFFNAQSYYATLAHESVHWTRHPSRLDRSFDQQRFGDIGYAKEELVAELGAAFLCADLGLKLEDRTDHAAYIGSWLQVLRNDKRGLYGCRPLAARHRLPAWLADGEGGCCRMKAGEGRNGSGPVCFDQPVTNPSLRGVPGRRSLFICTNARRGLCSPS